MKIGVPAETDPGESRVAVTPETVKKYAALGCEIVVQAGAGLGSNISDQDYLDAGAKIEKAADAALADADVVLKVRRPSAGELKAMKKGAIAAALMDPYDNAAEIKPFADNDVIAFAMELMPRISRAQSMDVLSSQSNLAGYKAVVDAAGEFNRAMPMMMTAAGTVPPARVFVMGAGVAGLQAIPKELIEAAKVDGASPWRRFWEVTFPLMLPVSITAILIRIIFKLKLADIIINVTLGGPGGATDSVTSFIFREYRDRSNVGYGTMLAMVYLVLIVIAMTILIKAADRWMRPRY